MKPFETLFSRRSKAPEPTSEPGYTIERTVFGDGRVVHWALDPNGRHIQPYGEPWCVFPGGLAPGQTYDGEPHPMGSLELAHWRIAKHKLHLRAGVIVSTERIKA